MAIDSGAESYAKMAVWLSSESFPSSPAIKEQAAVPWGAVVQPFGTLPEEDATSAVPVSEVARCSECFAYVNPFTRFAKSLWVCALCHASNKCPQRYATVQQRALLPELSRSALEFELDAAAAEQMGSGGGTDGGATYGGVVAQTPIYLFVVDTAGSAEQVELVKAAMLASLEALPPEAWVGLLVFSYKLGVFQLRAATPHVRYTAVNEEDGLAVLSFEDLLPIEQAVVPLGENRDHVSAAIESLAAQYDAEEDGKLAVDGRSQRLQDMHARRLRAFGPALQATLEYLRAGEAPLIARVMVFLCGRPNFGVGALEERAAAGGGDESRRLLASQDQFYWKSAIEAARAGTCIDVFAVGAGGNSTFELASLKDLTLRTGGNLLWYASPTEATLPQDLFRQLSQPQAFAGLLRVRTSREFQVSLLQGHLVPDDHVENLYHMAGCDARKCVFAELDFVSPAGFGAFADAQPVIQMAFAYTALARRGSKDGENEDDEDEDAEENEDAGPDRPPSAGAGDEEKKAAKEPARGSGANGSAANDRLVPVRRVRVVTVKAGVARNTSEVYSTLRPDVVVSLLTQQAIAASLEKGVHETRSLLQDWLVNLTLSYQTHTLRLAKFTPEAVDTRFIKFEYLQFIPRFIFALLRSPLFAARPVPTDERVYLQCLCRALEPEFLCRALYPQLSSWSDLDHPSKAGLFLTLQALQQSQDRVFVLDAFTSILVLYTHAAADLRCPPPQQCELRGAIRQLKNAVPFISPRVVFARMGTPEAAAFEAALLEDAEAADGVGFAQFEDAVLKEVLAMGAPAS